MEYQDRINFVILDYLITEQREFASVMSVAGHPAFAVIDVNQDPKDARDQTFGFQSESRLRSILEELIEA
ncbi:MAG: hypothetical protein CL752_03205 [Chloroflexi bacterium]|nr:hypothetical protein [Chloroflexota bacterium]|tara:strand:+ start:383 stop:592 length:210 start_codon:yes stop_codon:yes gene_type:complete